MLTRRKRAGWLLAVIAAAGVGTLPAADLRVVTYNVEALGTRDSRQYRALVDVLRRVDADVVLLQEVHGPAGDLRRVPGLAADAGYDHRCVSEVSGTLSGGLYNACLSRLPIGRCASRSAAELSRDRAANDITRDILEVHIEVEPGGAPWGFFTVHLKGGSEHRNKFRRQIELQRTVRAVRDFRRAHPDAPVVLAGDLNEDVSREPFGQRVRRRRPRGLPPSFRLGSDVEFPVVYDPFETLVGADLRMIDAFLEDRPGRAQTRWVSRRRLDYLWIGRRLRVDGAEVYDSCADNGRDDPPPGSFLPKPGAPLPCGRTGEASDHFPVFADLSRMAERPSESAAGDDPR